MGDAIVHLTHDRFYDIKIWGMMCIDQTSSVFPPVSVSITCKEGEDFGASFVLSTPLELTEEKPKLQYRFDDRDPMSHDAEFSALNNGRASVDFDRDEFLTFLENIATSSEITFSVGDVEETLQLKEMGKAVDEYRRILAEDYIIELEPNDVDGEEAETLNLPESDEQPATEDG